MLKHDVDRLHDEATIDLFCGSVSITCGSRNIDRNSVPAERMDGCINETRHIICLGKFENNQSYKEQIVREIVAAICAMINSNGGKVLIDFETDSNETPAGGSPFSQISLVIRILEQSMISIIGLHQTISNINFREDNESKIILVKKVDSLITINYNLYLPSQKQVAKVSPLEPKEKVKDDIINRKVILEPVQTGSHCQIFHKDSICRIRESKTVQLKYLEAQATKRTTLADRIVGKGNKFTCYVSAFANYSGGHIYYGITDDLLVIGELIENEEDKKQITKKVEKAIEKMIWPEHVGQPKQGEQWDIFFEPVVDKDNKPIPSTFVIVIYIAACLGGVFTEEPECYEMRKGKVTRMSLATWNKRMVLPGRLSSGAEIPRSIQRTKWSSAEARKSFVFGVETLRKLISNGHWDAIFKKCKNLRKDSFSCEMLLLILSKEITASYRRGHCKKAHKVLEEYRKILPQTKDRLIFEALNLYLEAAVKRASGDLKGLEEPLKAALSMLEMIEPGLVTAIVYLFAATVTDLVYSEERAETSPAFLSIRALEHLRFVPNSCEVRSDMEVKAHMTLATFHLGYNLNGQSIKDKINISDLEEAKANVTAINQRAEASTRTKYHDAQFNLLLSIYKYRKSQFNPDDRVRFLRNAYQHVEKAVRLAKDSQFAEVVEWGKVIKASYTEHLLLRVKFNKH